MGVDDIGRVPDSSLSHTLLPEDLPTRTSPIILLELSEPLDTAVVTFDKNKIRKPQI